MQNYLLCKISGGSLNPSSMGGNHQLVASSMPILWVEIQNKCGTAAIKKEVMSTPAVNVLKRLIVNFYVNKTSTNYLPQYVYVESSTGFEFKIRVICN